MPKHVLLGMTLRHLTGSAEIVFLVHRFGHCASYTCLLELKTAMSTSIDVSDTPGLGQLRLYGRNTIWCWATHTAHGLIIQAVFPWVSAGA